MGKGKPIYSGNVLGNRVGGKKASGKISPMYKANKQKYMKWDKKRSFKARRLIFKKNPISISSTEGHVLKEKHTVKPLDHIIEPIIAIATVVIQLPDALIIMIIKQEPDNHTAISENMLGSKNIANRIHMQISTREALS